MSQSRTEDQETLRQYVNMRDVHRPNARMEAAIFVGNHRNVWLHGSWMRTQHDLAVVTNEGQARIPTAQATGSVDLLRRDAQQSMTAAPINGIPAQAVSNLMDRGLPLSPVAVVTTPKEFAARQARALTSERHAYLIDSSESEDEDDEATTMRRVNSAAAVIPMRHGVGPPSTHMQQPARRPLALRTPGLPDIPAEAIQALTSMLEEYQQRRLGRAQG